MKKIVLTSIVFGSMLYAVEIANINQAVNLAGKQRMYTQRMLKDYAMVGMNNTFGKPNEDLNQTIADFEDHLVSLIAFNQDAKTAKALQEVNKKWESIKKDLTAKPQKENAEKLQVMLDELLKLADDATKAFATQSGKQSGEIINISGRQRMLSQRMAGLYMLKVWGVEDPQFREKLDNAMKLFKESLETLEKYEANTKEINELLAKVKRSFRFFEMMNKSTNRFIPTLIYKKSNDILRDMNDITIKYTELKTK
jgi:nitrate/nitrite-specific signal transduction histidine kinase